MRICLNQHLALPYIYTFARLQCHVRIRLAYPKVACQETKRCEKESKVPRPHIQRRSYAYSCACMSRPVTKKRTWLIIISPSCSPPLETSLKKKLWGLYGGHIMISLHHRHRIEVRETTSAESPQCMSRSRLISANSFACSSGCCGQIEEDFA